MAKLPYCSSSFFFLPTAYLNIALSTHCAFSAKGLHFSARRSTIPQNLPNFNGSHQNEKQDTPSTCLGVGRHFKLLCACANVATTWHCHGYQVASFSGFPPGNEASRSPAPERTLFSVERRVRSRLLQLFTLQAAEASQIHLSSPLAAAAWSCLSSEKISDQKKIHRTRQKKHFLQKFYVKRCRDRYAKKHSNKV